MNPIEASGIGLTLPSELTGVRGPKSAIEPGAESFGSVLNEAIGHANQSALEASHAAEEFAAGRRDDIHGTMLALSKADIELHLVGSVRNKVMDAFYELWRMQI